MVKNPKTGTIEKEILLDPKYFNGTNDLFARITLHPGCAVPVHQHLGNNETYYLLKGEGEYTDEDKTLTVKAGDVTFCADGGNPRAEEHRQGRSGVHRPDQQHPGLSAVTAEIPGWTIAGIQKKDRNCSLTAPVYFFCLICKIFVKYGYSMQEKRNNWRQK